MTGFFFSGGSGQPSNLDYDTEDLGFAANDAAPSGTSNGIVKGTATFNYESAYTIGRTAWISVNDTVVYCTGNTTVPSGNSAGTNPGRQMYINSAQGLGNEFNVAFNNCLLAASSARGLDNGDGMMCVYRTTMVGPGLNPNDADYSMEVQYTSGGNTSTLYVKNCILGSNVGNGTTTYYSDEDNIVLSLANNATSPNRPSDILRNANEFFLSADSRFMNYPLLDDGTSNTSVFRSDFSKILHSSNGSIGSRLIEYHSIANIASNTVSITIS